MLLNKEIEENTKFGLSDLASNFARLQRVAQSLDIPMLIVIEGWESSGKGYFIKKLVRELNPKYYSVEVFDNFNPDKSNYINMRKFWLSTPKKGHLTIFDKSYYYEIMKDLNISESNLDKKIDAIKSLEKTLYDDYTVVVKFFLNISEKEQSKRIDDYLDSEIESVYVSDDDRKQRENYEEYKEHFSKVLNRTNDNILSWNIIDMKDKKDGAEAGLKLAMLALERGIERVVTKREDGVRINREYQLKNRILEEVDLSKNLSEEEYSDQLKDLQKEAADIMLKAYMKDLPIILVFEGVDAAGKDGAINRLIKYMDPRLLQVHAISAPDEGENAHHYLWRFYKDLPEKGRMSIFSRSWYGRVMVERIEGFATDNEWERAYQEINHFEKQLADNKIMILKFFVTIDKDEQMKRFKAREENPDKQYKITEEDWRNRDKWDQYIEAMDEMLERTNTNYAPWIVVEGNDKKYARIKVLKEFIEYSKKFL